ncbi:hypothetical protein GOODEAATRI_019419 [Goodea atripinnis]|uniref:WDR11 TPR domain-containing protein n=1 Tax=Goodea atripinnis TaxID=208336 RepID=A0ABV0ML26_9TELE
MRFGRNVNYRILDIDWCTSDKVVLASDDGCIRVLEMAMKSASYRMDEQDLTEVFFSTCFPQQKSQLDRVHLQEVKRSSYEHTKKCADQLLLLGQVDNPSYYCDSLKACLVTTITSSGPSQSTIKLVATNMIANGKLAEGVQLLCLIDKAADACRYLQTYGEWNRAAWLAKVRLNSAESSDVLKRWAEHLCSPQVNQKSKAIMVLLSLGCFYKVGEMLHSMRYFDRAALFIEACLKYGVMEANDSSNILFCGPVITLNVSYVTKDSVGA